jgi:hypothetical protein
MTEVARGRALRIKQAPDLPDLSFYAFRLVLLYGRLHDVDLIFSTRGLSLITVET